MKAKDIYGNMGIVGCAVVHYENKAAVIEAFMLSCRVFNRSFEIILLSEIIKNSKKKGFEEIVGKYIRSEKNKLFESFYIDNGFTGENGTYIFNSDMNIKIPNTFEKIQGIQDDAEQ
jgi:predicted enzyme involved in methoxymalonyl-ACP biosynthesis